jgi:uncharacterized protein (DUF736 family)
MSETLGKGSLRSSNRKYSLTPEGKYVVSISANPKAPDYFGSVRIVVNGEEVELTLSGWIRDGQQKGEKYLSLAVEYGRNETKRLALLEGSKEVPAEFEEDSFPTPIADDSDDPLPF